VKGIGAPPEEQVELVGLLEEKLSVTDSLEGDLEMQLPLSNNLRQSILRRAFSGKLVEQSLEDEPASAVLERIRAVRDFKKNKTRRRDAA
jgi:type I restriction enzyme, S subunit